MSIFAPGSHGADHVVEGPFNPGTDMPTPGCLMMSQNLYLIYNFNIYRLNILL
mgnify:CR=1 FL=1